jgi:hypothetical protein
MKVKGFMFKNFAVLTMLILVMMGLNGCFGIQSTVVGPDVTEEVLEETELVESRATQIEIVPRPIPEILTYTNETYGFIFNYPETWTLTEKEHGVILEKDTNRLIVNFRWIEEEVQDFGPTGLSAGDLLYRDKVRFLNQVIPAEFLTYEGKTKAVLYGKTGYVEIKDLLFLVMLEDLKGSYLAVDLAEETIDEAKTILESYAWIGRANGSEKIGDQPIGGQYGKESSSFWVEMEGLHYGIRFAVPCFWHVDIPEGNYRGLTYSIRNYSYEYSLTFPRNDRDFWESGGIKINMAFPKKVRRDTSLEDYIASRDGEADDFKYISTEEVSINGQNALLVTTESVFGIGHFYLFDLNEDVFLLFSLSPGAIHDPDVQAILHSLAIDPDTPVMIPGFPPGYPLEEVITDCRGANELKVLMSSPKSLTWGSGEAVKLHFALINLTNDKLYILDWHTPFEGIAGDIFRVTYNGQLLPYQGILAMRGDPSPESYILIGPADAEIIEVNLSEVYDFSRPGTYSIVYKSPHTSHIARSEDDFATTLDELGPIYISSNEITAEIVFEN